MYSLVKVTYHSNGYIKYYWKIYFTIIEPLKICQSKKINNYKKIKELKYENQNVHHTTIR